MIIAYSIVNEVVPPSNADVGDLRKSILELPAFITDEWVSRNIDLGDVAMPVLALWADDIESETGAPMTRCSWPAGPSPREFRNMMRYPLFLRSIGSRCSMADPSGMPSIFSMFRSTFEPFNAAIINNRDTVEPGSTVSELIRAALRFGDEVEVKSVVEFLAATATLLAMPGVDEMIADFPGKFGDAGRCTLDAYALMASLGDSVKSEYRSADYFKAFGAFVPPRSLSEAYRLPATGDVEWLESLDVEGWFDFDEEMVKLIEAIAPEIERDSGYRWQPGGYAYDRLREGLEYPLFLPSLATRLSLLRPEEYPSWIAVFRSAAIPYIQATKEMEPGAERLTDAALRIYPKASREVRIHLFNWFVIEGLFSPTEAIVAFLRENDHPAGTLGGGPYRLARRLLDADELRPKEQHDEGGQRLVTPKEKARFAKPTLN